MAIRIWNRINPPNFWTRIRIRNLEDYGLRIRMIIFFISSSLFVHLFCNLLQSRRSTYYLGRQNLFRAKPKKVPII